MMKRHWTLVLLIFVLALACGPLTGTQPPTESPTEPPPGKGRCGDGVCDGPENGQNCPQDCATATVVTGGSDACSDPNPHRAVISEALLDWHDWLVDGGFETGETEIHISRHHLETLEYATADKSRDAARTGEWGYAITSDPGKGLTFTV